MRKLMTEETKAVSGGVYDVKKYGYYDGYCIGAKCGCCSMEHFSPWSWNGILGRRYAKDEAYACEITCLPIFIENGWECAGPLGR